MPSYKCRYSLHSVCSSILSVIHTFWSSNLIWSQYSDVILWHKSIVFRVICCDFNNSGHTNVVSDSSCTADEHKLATVSWDKSIKVWDISTGEYRWVQPGFQGFQSLSVFMYWLLLDVPCWSVANLGNCTRVWPQLTTFYLAKCVDLFTVHAAHRRLWSIPTISTTIRHVKPVHIRKNWGRNISWCQFLHDDDVTLEPGQSLLYAKTQSYMSLKDDLSGWRSAEI